MISRELLLAHLEGKPVHRLPAMPITMMFAGDLAGVPYRQYCTDHRALVDAQINVAERFGIDYVSCISDPAREAADCGAALEWFDNQPPAIIEDRALLSDKTALAKLTMPDPLGGGRMTDRIDAAALFREKCANRFVVEGWVEGPCAEAADLFGINNLMLEFYDDSAFVKDLFEFTTELALSFAREQIKAGADLIGIGDAAASLIGPELYEEFVWPREKRLVEGIHKLGARVRLHICGDTRSILAGMGRLGCEIVDLDFPVPVAEARQAMSPDQVLLGNLHPVALLRNGTPDAITSAIQECHRQAGARFIAGAGCEVPRDTPHENLRALIDYARAVKPEPSAS